MDCWNRLVLLITALISIVGCSTSTVVPEYLHLESFDPSIDYNENYHLAKPQGMKLRSLSRHSDSVTFRYGLGGGALHEAKEVLLVVKKSAQGDGARSFTELFDEGCRLYQHRQEAIQGLLNTVEVMACKPMDDAPGMVVANKSIRGPYHWFVATYYIPFADGSVVKDSDYEALPISPDQRFHLHDFLTGTELVVNPKSALAK
jgi:hypothetical protein